MIKYLFNLLFPTIPPDGLLRLGEWGPRNVSTSKLYEIALLQCVNDDVRGEAANEIMHRRYVAGAWVC
jgi:hypothetical protein